MTRNIFSILSTFKYNSGKANDKFINFYPVMSCRRIETESDDYWTIVHDLVARYGPQSVGETG